MYSPSKGFPLQLRIALAALFFFTNWMNPQPTSFPSALWSNLTSVISPYFLKCLRRMASVTYKSKQVTRIWEMFCHKCVKHTYWKNKHLSSNNLCNCKAFPDKKHISVQPASNFLLKSLNMYQLSLVYVPLPAIHFSYTLVQKTDCMTLNMTELWKIRNYSPNDKKLHSTKLSLSYHISSFGIQ